MMCDNMCGIGKYTPSDLMASLICDNFTMLIVMNRFGIPIGFSEKTIEEVCRENNVHTTTFLAVVNLLLRQNDNSYKPSLEGVSAEALVAFLHREHDYYKNERIPRLRKKLLSVLGDDTISNLIVRYFNDYVLQIMEHFRYEEEVLFLYVLCLARGEEPDDHTVERYIKRHDHIDEPLTEFKNVIIKYYSHSSDEIIAVIYHLLSCANDLQLHNMIEDRLLVPLAQILE